MIYAKSESMKYFSRLLLLFFGVLSLGVPGAVRAEDFARQTPLEHELSRYVVSPATFGRRQLYTWTKPEQIAELRVGQEILSRRVSSAGEPSRFDLILADKTFDGFPLIVALRDARFARKRFAWAAAWPTVMGWEKESYGDQLLQITLKDDAIIIAFMPFCESKFACRNALGQELDEAFVLAHPDKIAAGYLCKLCESSGGRLLQPEELGKLLAELKNEKVDAAPTRKLTSAWDRVWVFWVIGGLFGRGLVFVEKVGAMLATKQALWVNLLAI